MIRSAHGTHMRAYDREWKVDLMHGQPQAWEHWYIEDWGGKVAFKAIHSPGRFLRARSNGSVDLVGSHPKDCPESIWKPFKNSDGTWSFLSAHVVLVTMWSAACGSASQRNPYHLITMAFTIIFLLFSINCVNACIKMVPPDMEGLSTTDMPITNEPVTEEPVTDEPITNEPVTEEPVTDEPVTEEPITEEPMTDEPITDEPITDVPVTDEPVTDEPVTEEPVTDEPVTDEPVTDEPITEEPITDEPVTEAPDCNSCTSPFKFADAATVPESFFPNNVQDLMEGDCSVIEMSCIVGGTFTFVHVKYADGSTQKFDRDDTGPYSIEFVDRFVCQTDGTWLWEEYNKKITSYFCSRAK